MTATDRTHPDTIDWNRYWTDADDEARESATPSAHHMRELLADFVAAKSVPDTVADVGCGPGVVTFDLADRFPETTVVGYDAAEPILTENRTRAREEGIENVRFEQAVLPEFAPDTEFDLVVCYGTLCYVPESARALQALYDAVAPGGHLVLGYMNSLAAAHHRRLQAADPDELDHEFDPDAHRERFGLVMREESTLSYRQIHDAVGTWPRSFWEVTEKPEQRWAWRHVPSVWIPK
ncbi:class I SAM-dependent methyltransferase [Haloarchaeobius sp. TZWWS8]|uniref:class I SAM-dependent methyltransferase n=1 Tax=Haloarchaeobius sp. TZWWS8 TaxID=3446121 RepID=UPI003EBFAD5B